MVRPLNKSRRAGKRSTTRLNGAFVLAGDDLDRGSVQHSQTHVASWLLLTYLLTTRSSCTRFGTNTSGLDGRSCSVGRPARLSMAWKRSGSSLLSPNLQGGYRIFGRSMHRTLMLEVVGIGGHPGAGGSHCSIPHLKPDKQLLINSQAVYRPSLVENS
jgi:hypothetical protein